MSPLAVFALEVEELQRAESEARLYVGFLVVSLAAWLAGGRRLRLLDSFVSGALGVALLPSTVLALLCIGVLFAPSPWVLDSAGSVAAAIAWSLLSLQPVVWLYVLIAQRLQAWAMRGCLERHSPSRLSTALGMFSSGWFLMEALRAFKPEIG